MDWWVWLAGGLVLLVIELATPSGFFVMFFGLGALTVGILTRLGIASDAWLQWLIFTASSILFLLLFRGRFQRRMEQPHIDVNSFIGELAVARERIDPGAPGRVDLRGTLWNARNISGNVIDPGQRCRVTGADAGLVVFVQPE